MTLFGQLDPFRRANAASPSKAGDFMHSSDAKPSTLHRSRLLPFAASLSVVLLAGCGTIQPKPLTHDEILARVQHDRQAMYEGQAPVTAPLTLADALARALKYNLDYRLKLKETALSQNLLDVSRADMLPKLMADAGYRFRSNDSGGTSIGIEDRVVSLRPSTSEQREHFLGSASFSWNALDFGLSYFNAKQRAEDVNIAGERRRDVLQTIVQDVRDAYWRALGAQRLLDEADALSRDVADALEKSRQAERSGVLPPIEGLEYQRALLDAETLVNQKRQEMQFARRELAALMNLPADTQFVLADAPETALSAVPADLDKLEQMALELRPELRQEDYRARADVYETRKQMAALFPNLNLFASASTDSNDYLYNNDWSAGGLDLTLDLFRLASLPARKRTNEARLEMDEARRLALSMAVLTQVRVAVERYKLALYDHRIAEESARVDQRLASIAQASSDNRLISGLELLRRRARALVSRFDEASSYASAQSSYGRILDSVGIDLMPETARDADLGTLAEAIERSLQAGEGQVFVSGTSAAVERRPMRLDVQGLPPGVDAGAVRRAVEGVMTGNALALGDGPDALGLELRFSTQPADGASRRGRWTIRVADMPTRTFYQQQYDSFLPAEASTRTLVALAEAATLSVVSDLKSLGTAPSRDTAGTGEGAQAAQAAGAAQGAGM